MSVHSITIEGSSSVRLPVAGKYCDRDIVVTAVSEGVDLPELSNPAAAGDMAEGKELIDAEGNVVTGTLMDNGQAFNTTTTNVSLVMGGAFVRLSGTASDDQILRKGCGVNINTSCGNFGDASASDVAEGKTFTSSAGLKKTGTLKVLDTSDATATAGDIVSGATAYVNGEKITGTIKKNYGGISAAVEPSIGYGGSGPMVQLSYTPAEPSYISPSTGGVYLRAPLSSFGDATAEDVAKGKTFTSAEGLKATGTFTLEDEMTEQDSLIEQIKEALKGKAAGGGNGLLEFADASASKKDDLDSFRNLRINFMNVTTFEYESFYECSAIIEAVAPIAETVGNSAFGYCNRLSMIDMPLVTTVEEAGFVSCNTLTDVNLPSVKTIGVEAFASCYTLEKIDLPSVESIGELAFAGCDSLTTVILRTTETVCVCALDAFDRTPIMQGMGNIYVPTVMYEYYRAGYEAALNEMMPGFFDILFRKIEDYPEICG